MALAREDFRPFAQQGFWAGVTQAKNQHSAACPPRHYTKLGGAAGLVAIAHKLDRIIDAVMTSRQPYKPELHTQAEKRRLSCSLKNLRAKAQIIGFELTEIQQSA
jgi:hypothetical protein